MIRVGNKVILFKFVESITRVNAKSFTIRTISGDVVSGITREQIEPFVQLLMAEF